MAARGLWKGKNMNVVVLIGRLVRDPEIRYTDSQMPVCTATLAVNRPVKGDAEKQADFIRITVFGKAAETFSRYLTKGRQVAVEGRIQTGSYQNQKGDTVYTTDVVVSRFEFIGNSRDGGSFNRPQEEQSNESSFGVPEGFEAIDDDIPF